MVFDVQVGPYGYMVVNKKKGIEVGRLDNSYYDRERRVRRWFGEVIITCYQTTVLVEAGRFGNASAHLFEDSRRWVSCGVRELLLCGESW